MDETHAPDEVTIPSEDNVAPIAVTSHPEEVTPVADTTLVSQVAPALTPQEPLVLQVSTPSAPQTPPDPLLSSAPQETVRIVQKEVIREVPVEKVIEKIIEREVIKEVPVEKIIEKVIHAPPSKAEFDIMLHEYLFELSKQGTAKKHELMLAKEGMILELADTHSAITHRQVMDALDLSSTTATRLLHMLCKDGKLTMHGTTKFINYTKVKSVI